MSEETRHEPPVPAQAEPQDVPDLLPKPQAARPAGPVDDGIERNALGAPRGKLSWQEPPPRIGDRSGANIGVAGSGQPEVDEAAKEKYRYPKGRPVQSGQAPPQSIPHSTVKAENYDADGLWEPAAHEELIVNLPPPGNGPRRQ